EQRAAGERRRGIDRDHADAVPFLAVGGDERGGECALAGAGRAGDADTASATDALMPFREQRIESVAVVLDDADRPCERGFPACREILEQTRMIGHLRAPPGAVAGSSCSSRMS